MIILIFPLCSQGTCLLLLVKFFNSPEVYRILDFGILEGEFSIFPEDHYSK